MNKKEAIDVMKRIQKYFMDVHYPLKDTMYDRKNTVKQMFDEALEVLEKEE